MDCGALQEAFSAGWSVKSKTAQQRKGRGYKGDGKPKGKGKGKGKRPPDTRTPDARKKNSTCASCGQRGHWKGDDVRSGKDAVHQKRDNEAHFSTGAHKGQRHPSAGPARPVKSEPPPEREPIRRRPQPLPDRRRPAEPSYPPPGRERTGTKRRGDTGYYDDEESQVPEPGTKGLSAKTKARRPGEEEIYQFDTLEEAVASIRRSPPPSPLMKPRPAKQIWPKPRKAKPQPAAEEKAAEPAPLPVREPEQSRERRRRRRSEGEPGEARPEGEHRRRRRKSKPAMASRCDKTGPSRSSSSIRRSFQCHRSDKGSNSRYNNCNC